MSFYRTLIAAVAAFGLATSVFAADEATTANTTDKTATQATQPHATEAQASQAATTDATAATPATDKVNLNTASAKDLMKVKGLNAAKAKAIVSYRKKHGDFKSVEALKDVKGFKKLNEKTMKEIQDQVTV